MTHAQIREFALSDGEFRFIAGIVHRKTGIVLTEAKRDMMYGRLSRRLRTLGLSSFSDYCALLKSGDTAELGELTDAITTNLTRFFRESHHFEHLRGQFMVPLAAKKPERLRLWSAACSSGMEPYSMAMVMRGALPKIREWDAKILATDIDRRMVETAQGGIYNAADVTTVPEPYRRFMREEEGRKVAMDDELKKLIAFKTLNLLADWPMTGRFDVIFCRNVVIYFDTPTKKRVFERMADILRPGGFLYVGHSETLNGLSTAFTSLGHTIYQRKP